MVRHTLKTGCPQVLESPGIKKVSWKVLDFLIFVKNPGKVQECYKVFVQ